MIAHKSSTAMLHLVSFKLGDEEFALDITQVQEINRPTQVTRIPNTQSYIYGVINLRGKVIPIVDLGEKFGLPHRETTKDTRIMVVAVQDMGRVGLIVDSVSEVLRLPEETLEQPPMMIKGISSEFIQAIGKLEDRLILLLDLARLFRDVELPGVMNSPLVLTAHKDAVEDSIATTGPEETPVPRDSALQEVVEVAKAMAEGNFHQEINPDLYGQVGELAKYIHLTLKKLQQAEPDIKATTERLPQASVQLSEISKMTEEATHRVMSHVEQVMDNHDMIMTQLGQLETVSVSMEGAKHPIKETRRLVAEDQEALMEIMTGLSFQDLTGQKIKKIIVMVEEIEKKVLKLLVTFGIQSDSPEKKEEILREVTTAQDIKQDRVDEILKQFGF